MKYTQWIRGWPPWVWTLVGVFTVGIVLAAVLVWRDDGIDTATPGTTTTQPATTTTSSTTTTTPPPTTTQTTTTTPLQPTTTKVPPVRLPGIVIASAGSAGGSGEVQVVWKAAVRATGYRVYSTDSAGGNARLMADINIITGRTKAAPEVVYLQSDEHTYVPDRGPLAGADHSSRFQYIDVGISDTRYYRVRAYNAAGAGPLSAVTSGIPVIGPAPSLPS